MTKKNKGLKVINVDMGMFQYDVRVCFGTWYQVLEHCAKLYDTTVEGVSKPGRIPRGICFRRSGYVPVIWMPHYPETASEQATFAHEAIHAVMWMLDDYVEVPVNLDTDEVLAHDVSHVLRTVAAKLKRP